MLKVVSVEKMRQIEAAADASGLSYDQMMQNAGSAVAQRVLQILADRPDARVTVLVGGGNNGGDGLVAGRIIAQHSDALVRFYLLKPRPDDDANFTAVREAGLFMAQASDDRDFRVLRNMVASADVVVDALFGIGARLPITGEATKVMRNVNHALNDEQQPEHAEGQIITPASPTPHSRTKPWVIAVDCPSGLNCDTGELDRNVIFADETVTFIAAKPGLFDFPGAGAVGQLQVATIGVPADLPALQEEKHQVADSQMVKRSLPPRPAISNKGTYGKTLVVAGSMNYTGAAGLSALAAYRAGTGLVTVATPSPVAVALSTHLLETTWLLLPHDMGILSSSAAQVLQKEMGAYDAMLLGPGWGREQTTREMLVALLKTTSEGRKSGHRESIGFVRDSTASQENGEENKLVLPPLVIDADGLNLLSELDSWWSLLPEGTIITPHPGEMGRLAKLTTQGVLANRWELAVSKAAEWNVILVLKGAHTLIAAPDGAVTVLPFKTDALATAGTGDVLAGAITGLRAQGIPPYEAAVLGGYIHGLAGTLAGKRVGNTRSVIAGDVLDSLPEAISLLEGA